jgi:hypothetical protein
MKLSRLRSKDYLRNEIFRCTITVTIAQNLPALVMASRNVLGALIAA